MRSWNDDPFTKKARRENYEARSVYKLEEIQKRDGILTGARLILDLGASPGSWTQYCLRVVPTAIIYAVDITPMNIVDPRLHFSQADVSTLDPLKIIAPHDTVDVVLSDMAPKTTGIRSVDAERSFELVLTALAISDAALKKGGHCVAKLFMSDSLRDIEDRFRKGFESVRLLRPESTRKQSREIFVVGKGKR